LYLVVAISTTKNHLNGRIFKILATDGAIASIFGGESTDRTSRRAFLRRRRKEVEHLSRI
jgi:hypothetical protein